MKLSKHAFMLEVTGNQGKYYPVLLHDGNDLILVDTGFPFDFEALKAAIKNCGFKAADINRIILTHQDIDHIGNAKEFTELSPGIEIMAGKDEAPYIDGRLVPVKLSAMDANNPFYEQFKSAFDSRRVKIDRELADGEVLPFCGGTEIIATPGHTPGHICVYVREDKLLIVGDAMNITDGKLVEANPDYTADMDLANSSIQKLTEFDVELIAVYHGGKYEGGVNITV